MADKTITTEAGTAVRLDYTDRLKTWVVLETDTHTPVYAGWLDRGGFHPGAYPNWSLRPAVLRAIAALIEGA